MMARLPFFPFQLLSVSSRFPVRMAAVALAAELMMGLSHAQVQAQAAPAPQNSAAGPAASTPAGPAASISDEAWLKTTSSLYYSSAKAGLSGFDCAVHPDWRTLLAGADEGSAVAADDARVQLLQTVKINLHAHMQGNSSVDWNQDQNPGPPRDGESTALLAKMHQTTEQTLEGFLQFWTPFIDGSVVPESAEGLAITHTGTLHTIHAEQGDTALTETFSSDSQLKHFDVNTKGISIQFQPAYKPTDQGLLVQSFQAHVQAGTSPDEAEEMHVEIEYQKLDGFPIPSRLHMDVTNTGKYTFALDGCTVSRLQKPEPAQTVKPALQ